MNCKRKKMLCKSETELHTLSCISLLTEIWEGRIGRNKSKT